ncbi:hypothetical protein TEA_026845 [Camellia sinensis var. sinensis]|uniref:Phytocyanin domain-containing protein n=1 Tax=Camellia sinensis var. sinensis TaxID=542762 RepID=A0A4S4E9B9_CAMSN|nr:hypothetical protein TEA_026845 [Camellia sinensis var. sinensis]
MGLGKKLVIMLVMVVSVCGVSKGAVYKVGDSAGWTNTGHYNKQFHNVIRVTHKNFNACNATAPYFTLNSGNDSFTITRGGHFYFICSLPGHCEAGQKVDVRVPKTTNTTAPHPTSSPAPAPHQTPQSPPLPSPSLSPSPPVLLSPVPAPNVPAPQNSASSLSKVWLSIVVLSFSVSGFAY